MSSRITLFSQACFSILSIISVAFFTWTSNIHIVSDEKFIGSNCEFPQDSADFAAVLCRRKGIAMFEYRVWKLNMRSDGRDLLKVRNKPLSENTFQLCVSLCYYPLRALYAVTASGTVPDFCPLGIPNSFFLVQQQVWWSCVVAKLSLLCIQWRICIYSIVSWQMLQWRSRCRPSTAHSILCRSQHGRQGNSSRARSQIRILSSSSRSDRILYNLSFPSRSISSHFWASGCRERRHCWCFQVSQAKVLQRFVSIRNINNSTQ